MPLPFSHRPCACNLEVSRTPLPNTFSQGTGPAVRTEDSGSLRVRAAFNCRITDGNLVPVQGRLYCRETPRVLSRACAGLALACEQNNRSSSSRCPVLYTVL